MQIFVSVPPSLTEGTRPRSNRKDDDNCGDLEKLALPEYIQVMYLRDYEEVFNRLKEVGLTLDKSPNIGQSISVSTSLSVTAYGIVNLLNYV